MRKILLYTIFTIVLFAFLDVNAFFNVNKEKTVLINYWNNEELFNIITEWHFEIYIPDDRGLSIENSILEKKIYLNVDYKNYSKHWLLYIKLDKEVKKIEYDINVEYLRKDKDISNNIKKTIQNKPLSCESSATADIVSYFTWKDINEQSIFSILPKDMPYKSKKSWNSIIWWNPDKWFVWYVWYYWKNNSIRPSQKLYTWYWVYEKPIKDVYTHFGLKTKIINKKDYNIYFNQKNHLNVLLKTLNKWNMVQLWGDWCTDPAYEDWTIKSSEFTEKDANMWKSWINYCVNFASKRELNWLYKENWKLISQKWLNWEHAFYLLWYEWGIDNPDKIIVWDTYTWLHKYSTIEWMRKWEKLDYRSIIVYKPVD